MIKKSLNAYQELKLIKDNAYSEIIGIDEVGRGSWAGPVYVAGYSYSIGVKEVDGVNDSKLILPKKREKLFNQFQTHNYKIEVGSVESINSIGIGKTIEDLIQKIIQYFNISNAFFIIDGQFKNDFGVNTIKLNKADSNYYSVASASIIAKVARDNFMLELAKIYPKYGFETNKGYGTKLHQQVLSKKGPSDIHRRSFDPIKKLLS